MSTVGFTFALYSPWCKTNPYISDYTRLLGSAYAAIKADLP